MMARRPPAWPSSVTNGAGPAPAVAGPSFVGPPMERQQHHSHHQHPHQPPAGTAAAPVPYNWHRQLTDTGLIVYINATTNDVLRNHQEVRAYLSKDGTCKCGLECPLIVEQVFNFDPRLPSQPYNYTLNGEANAPGPNLCNHKRKIQALAAYDHHLQNSNQPNFNNHHFVQQPAFHSPGYAVHQGIHEVTAVTPAITDVIPSIASEIGHQQHSSVSYHPHPPAAHPHPPQVVQLVNASFQFASGAVTVVHQQPPPVINAHPESPYAAPQLLSPIVAPMQGHPYPATAYQPQQSPYHPGLAHYNEYGQQLPGLSMSLVNGNARKNARQRKKETTYRPNRHPPTVAKILAEAEKKAKIEAEVAAMQHQQQQLNSMVNTSVIEFNNSFSETANSFVTNHLHHHQHDENHLYANTRTHDEPANHTC